MRMRTFDDVTMQIIKKEKKASDFNDAQLIQYAADLAKDYCNNDRKYKLQILWSYIYSIFLMGMIIFSWWNMYKHQIILNTDFPLLTAVTNILLGACSIYAIYYLITSGKISLLIVDVFNSIRQLGRLGEIREEIDNIIPEKFWDMESYETTVKVVKKLNNTSFDKTISLIIAHVSYAGETIAFDDHRNIMDKLVISYIALFVFLAFI